MREIARAWVDLPVAEIPTQDHQVCHLGNLHESWQTMAPAVLQTDVSKNVTSQVVSRPPVNIRLPKHDTEEMEVQCATRSDKSSTSQRLAVQC